MKLFEKVIHFSVPYIFTKVHNEKISSSSPILPVPNPLPPVTCNHYNHFLVSYSKVVVILKQINTDIYSPAPPTNLQKER